jgi:putative oxidoreductase
MRKMLYCDTVGNLGSLALLLVRVVMGLAFFYHGMVKVDHAQTWMSDMAEQAQKAGQTVPPAPPPWVQATAAYAEYIGGPLLMVGFLTRFASLALIGMMAGAMYFVHLAHKDVFVAVGDASYEKALFYGVCAIMFFVLGPGRLSFDWIFFRSPPPPQKM